MKREQYKQSVTRKIYRIAPFPIRLNRRGISGLYPPNPFQESGEPVFFGIYTHIPNGSFSNAMEYETDVVDVADEDSGSVQELVQLDRLTDTSEAMTAENGDLAIFLF